MRSFNSLASWRWCLLAVLAVGCAHSGASTSAAPAPSPESSPPAAVSEAPAARSSASGPEARRRKEQKVRRLMVLTGAEDSGKQMLDLMTTQFSQMSHIPPGFMEKFREVAEEESIVDLLVPVYMKHLSEEDLDAAIAFHESPAGKRFLAAQPRLLEEAKEIGEQWGMNLAEKTLRALAEEERQRELKAVRHEGQQL
ncbi:DUF2059 domain-containing protein [Vitiosangium sp. GDMCC 1.1324]|uniref:DUF2059 domain-containing protein n=1 Tax=Vitiosangium sp. (strain GDMCC 1.1324) TaxID=2138576 RepID=UPI000D331B70|nr:DUF2059 domain-containing protein [Vitiosangium sp. GDMCC 1.1324]PTL75491.1 hypothetical protein DAT35_54505 [Vitiosangium sp. GDMCC 1.1324]